MVVYVNCSRTNKRVECDALKRASHPCHYGPVRALRAAVATAVIGALPAVAYADVQPVPAEFVSNLVYVTPVAANGRTVRFFTDTGGGWNAISADVARELGLSTVDTVMSCDTERNVVPFPDFETPIPRAPDHYLDGNLVVTDSAELNGDGFLGGRWHADRIWRFDYVEGALSVLTPEQLPKTTTEAVPLGFQVNSEGNRTMHFPRITISIAGSEYELLLDTGATAHLAEDSARFYGLPLGSRTATSFIARTVFEEWRAANPEWRVLPRGDVIRGNVFPLIEVPQVTIGGHTVGPVWFAQRPDSAFREWMTQMMDKPIDGAIGGSAFQYFRMTIDYPNSVAYFEQPDSETPAHNE